VSEAVVRVSCVRHTYPDRTEVHLCGLDFVVERGERAVILGPNGCGKTTLLYHLLGLLQPQEGDVRVFGVDPAADFNKIRERVGVLLQNVEEQIIAPTVWDDVSFSPRSYGYDDGEVNTMVQRALDLVGIAHLRDKVCHHLSGGERRKVALAGALVLNPELLVMDEPFEGLDPASRSDLCDLLNWLNREHGVTLVMATHDVDVVPEMADRVYVLLRGGEIVAEGTPTDIFKQPEMLRASNVEPPALAELFQMLAEQGLALGAPLDVEEAARLLLVWAEEQRAAGRSLPPRPAAEPAPASPAQARPESPGGDEPVQREIELPLTEPPVDEGTVPAPADPVGRVPSSDE